METLLILFAVYTIGHLNTNDAPTAPDYSSSATKLYATRPTGDRDYTKPSYTIDGGYIYQNMPYSDRVRDYRVAPMKIQNKK